MDRQPAAQIQPEQARYTSFADTLESDSELDEADPASGGTLESEMEAADDELDGAAEIPGPEIRD